MKFISSRNNNTQSSAQVSFAHSILDCMPKDGGLYVPAYEENLRPWILYMDQDTSFSSMAGALTSALIKEEFSPIISEAIAFDAFPFSPNLKKLDDNLFVLELFHGPTGCYKDFAVSYLASCLEHVLLMDEKEATVLAVTNGETGASLINAFKGKKHLKAVLLYTKGTMREIDPESLIENGGNIYAVEVDGSEEDCFEMVRKIYADKELVEKFSLTLANTINIGRILPLVFTYVYAFSRLKTMVDGDIFYAVDAGNYSNLVAGLYAWKFSLPVTGFVTNCTDSLVLDPFGKACVLDSVVPLHKRSAADPANPSNLERLEEVFDANPAVLKGLVFPAMVSENEQAAACKEAFVKYGYFLDPETASEYAAMKKRVDLVEVEDGAVVLLARNHPSLSYEKIKHWCGEGPVMPENLKSIYKQVTQKNVIPADYKVVVDILYKIQ